MDHHESSVLRSEIITEIDVLPINQLYKVQDFIKNLPFEPKKKEKLWSKKDSLMNTQRMTVGLPICKRDDLYDR